MSTALVKTPLRQVPDVRHLLMNENARTQLAMVAAKHMSPERMMRVVANAIRTTPKLQQCEPMSFLGALMQCAALGLEPNTVLGHAYMIPFERSKKIKNAKGVDEWVKIPEVQVVIGYKGLIDLARRSGHITSLSANIHYSDDELWEYEEGTEARLRHRPGMMAGDKLHAYAIAKFKDGGHAYVVLPWSKVMKIRDESQGWMTAKRIGKTADTPWGKYEDEMAKKTAVRALAKYLPLSVEFMDAVQIDEARGDYRAFAMDPTAGVQIEDQSDAIEGEASEDEDETTEREGAEPKQDQSRTRNASTDRGEGAKAADKPKDQRATRNTDAAADEQGSRVEGTKDLLDGANDAAQYQAIVDRVAGELLDGAPPEDVLDLFKVEIAAMKRDAPGIYMNLKAEVVSYAPDLSSKL
ncbi:recombinase RecT [Pararhodobacter sp.]|uniref:recombinase RecT n=1 Tax=Pararhodobacter sp. TaxID=2127056 RepID=UPI002FDDFD0B